MRKFQVTVNGNTYEVDVVEIANGAPIVTTPEVYMAPTMQMTQAPVAQAPSAQQAPMVQAPIAQAPIAQEQATPTKSGNGQVGSTKMLAPMQGKIVAVKVTEGQKITKGTVVAVLEAMKMENELVAPVDGVVASINVTVGQTIKPSELVASIS